MTDSAKPLSGLTTALEFIGDSGLKLDISQSHHDLSGVTLQCWVRPEAAPKTVTFFADPGLHGISTKLKPGFHRDVTMLPMMRDPAQSVRVPDGFVVFGFENKAGTGPVYRISTTDSDMSYPVFASVLIIDLEDRFPQYCIADNGDEALVLPLGRMETLTEADQARLDHILVPQGLELTCYDKPGCKGHSETCNDVDDRMAFGFTPLSLAVTRNEDTRSDGRNAVGESDIAIAVDSNGVGLTLKKLESSNPVAPLVLKFGNLKLRRDRWQHIACCFDGSTAKLYLNGRKAGSRSRAELPELQDALGVGYEFTGQMRALKLHKEALSEAQIAATRFDEPDSDDETLIEGWPMTVGDPANGDAEVDENLVYGIHGSNSNLTGQFWVKTEMPRNPATSAAAKQIRLERQAQLTTQQLAEDAVGDEQVRRAHARIGEKLDAEHARIEALTYAANLQGIFAIVGKELLEFGPRGAERHNWSKLLSQFGDHKPDAFAFDAAFGDLFVALTGWAFVGAHDDRRADGARHAHTLVRIDGNGTVSTIYKSDTTIRAIAYDPSGWSGNPVVYWVADDAWFKGIELVDGKPVYRHQEVHVASAPPAPHWSMTLDQARKVLIWSNGAEIWSTTVRTMYNWNTRILVPHGKSPNPIALLAEQDSGDVFWIDGTLDLVRRCTSDGERIWDLYPAPAAGAAIAIDYFDASHLRSQAAGGTDIAKRRRLYWTSRSVATAAARQIDSPGVICDLRHPAVLKATGTPAHAAEMLHLVDTSWQKTDEAPVLRRPGGGYLETSWTTEDGACHALFIGGADGPEPQVLDLATMEPVSHLHGWDAYRDTYMPNGWAYDSEADEYFTTMYDGGRGDFVEGYEGVQPWDTSRRNRLMQYDTSAPGVYDDLSSSPHLSLSPNGAYLAACREDDGIQIWDRHSGHVLKILPRPVHGISCMTTFERNGRQMLAAGFYDNKVHVWDIETEAHREFIGHTGIVLGIGFSPRAEKMITTSFNNNTARIWDMASGNCLKTLNGHTDAVYEGILHPDGERAITSSIDNTIRVWDIHTGNCLRTIETDKWPTGIKLAPDGRTLYFRTEDSLWQTDLHHHPFALTFDGNESAVELGDVVLNLSHGFGAELQIKPDGPTHDTLFSLGAPGQDRLTLTLIDDGTVRFEVANKTGQSGSMEMVLPGALNDWHTITVSMDAAGATILQAGLDHQIAAQLPVPPNGHRTGSAVGGPAGNPAPNSAGHYTGEISIVRLWNRALTPAEITAFHNHPMRGPAEDVSRHVTQAYSKTSAHTYLMSGMDDASSPPVPLFEFSSDFGLALRSRTSTAHEQLLAAQQDKIAQDRETHRLQLKAQIETAQQLADARQDHLAKLAQAKDRRTQAVTESAAILAPAKAEVAAAEKLKQQKIDEGNAKAAQIKADGDAKAARHIADVTKKADDRRALANARLADANRRAAAKR